tara:strand:+ start:39 stop:812 length:774 start_codon:yes stop_codon:yes gene_type:complete
MGIKNTIAKKVTAFITGDTAKKRKPTKAPPKKEAKPSETSRYSTDKGRKKPATGKVPYGLGAKAAADKAISARNRVERLKPRKAPDKPTAAKKISAATKKGVTKLLQLARKAKDSATGAKKREIEIFINTLDRFKENQYRYGSRETMRRGSGETELPGATRTNKSGEPNAMLGKERVYDFLGKITDDQFQDSEDLINKGIKAAGISAALAGAIGYAAAKPSPSEREKTKLLITKGPKETITAKDLRKYDRLQKEKKK